MSKLLLMARVTYRRRVFSSSFLLLTLGMPAVMIVAAAVPILQARRSSAPRLGFVDLSHQLNPVRSVEVDGKSLAVETFDNPESARRAVESGDLDGFLVLPANFREGNDAQYFGLEFAFGDHQPGDAQRRPEGAHPRRLPGRAGQAGRPIERDPGVRQGRHPA